MFLKQLVADDQAWAAYEATLNKSDQRGRESLTRLRRFRIIFAMPRRSRIDTGGYVYHVLNRAVGRSRIFDNEADYQAMLRVIERTHDRLPIRLLSFCLGQIKGVGSL